MSKIYIGIDLGLKGAIAVIVDGKEIYYCAMPLTPSGKLVDAIAVYKALRKYKDHETHLVVEQLKGFFGFAKKALASIMRQAGTILAIAELLRIPVTEVGPKQWQKELFQGVPMVYKTKKTKKVVDGETETSTKTMLDTKKMALEAVRKLFPKETFLATKRSSVPHDGIVDAILLAEYGRRKNL